MPGHKQKYIYAGQCKSGSDQAKVPGCLKWFTVKQALADEGLSVFSLCRDCREIDSKDS